MNTLNQYLSFTAEDFFNDPSFWNWVLQEGTEEENLFWEGLYTLHPAKQGEIDEARFAVINLHQESFALPEQRVTKLWNRIAAGINGPAARNYWTSFSRMGVAASFAGLLIALSVLFYIIRESAYTKVKTDFGNRKEVKLPDGSSLILNGNSSLRYATSSFNKQRQVWVKGQVYFNVVHTRNNQKFIVHTDEVDIQVLGTSFDVTSRNEKTDVVLNTGKIKLNIRNTLQQLMMKPGERVHYSADAEELRKEKVNVNKYTSWRKNTLIFENDSLAYVFDLLRDSYNMKFTVEDNNILKKKITAQVPANQPELLLKGLTEAHNLKFTNQKGGWIVTAN